MAWFPCFLQLLGGLSRPNISAHSKPCTMPLKCFECNQNKTFQLPRIRRQIRLWMSRNTGLVFWSKDLQKMEISHCSLVLTKLCVHIRLRYDLDKIWIKLFLHLDKIRMKFEIKQFFHFYLNFILVYPNFWQNSSYPDFSLSIWTAFSELTCLKN